MSFMQTLPRQGENIVPIPIRDDDDLDNIDDISILRHADEDFDDVGMFSCRRFNRPAARTYELAGLPMLTKNLFSCGTYSCEIGDDTASALKAFLNPKKSEKSEALGDTVYVTCHPHPLQKFDNGSTSWYCDDRCESCSRESEGPTVRWSCRECGYDQCRACVTHHKASISAIIVSGTGLAKYNGTYDLSPMDSTKVRQGYRNRRNPEMTIEKHNGGQWGLCEDFGNYDYYVSSKLDVPPSSGWIVDFYGEANGVGEEPAPEILTIFKARAFPCHDGHYMEQEAAWTGGTCDICNKDVSKGDTIRSCKSCNPEYWVCKECEESQAYTVPSLGEELTALSARDGYYQRDDTGRVSHDAMVHEGTMKFCVTWYSSQKESFEPLDEWPFRFSKSFDGAIPLPGIGDVLEEMQFDRNVYDTGQRCHVKKISSAKNVEFEVAWYGSRRNDSHELLRPIPADHWPRLFKYIASGVCDPSPGDEIKVLDSASDCPEKFPISAVAIGDRGRVSIVESQEFQVTWYRTGVTSKFQRDDFLLYFRIFGKTVTMPDRGDLVDALPGSYKYDEADGRQYFEAGDTGQISGLFWSDGTIDRFEVTWHRTGLTSIAEVDTWMRSFRLMEEEETGIPPGDVLPVGCEVEALPNAGLPGESGIVTKSVYVTDDGTTAFEVTWSSNEKTNIKQDAWLKQIRRADVREI